MDLTPLISSDRMVIQSYGADGFKISGQHYSGHVIVFPDHVENWSGEIGDLAAYQKDLDVILYGSGKVLRQLMPAQKQGLHLDVMDTGAACRTYNVLMAEGRRVAAALLKP